MSFKFHIIGINQRSDAELYESSQVLANTMYDELEKIVPEIEKDKHRLVFNYSSATEKMILNRATLSPDIIHLINKAEDAGKLAKQ